MAWRRTGEKTLSETMMPLFAGAYISLGLIELKANMAIMSSHRFLDSMNMDIPDLVDLIDNQHL